ncbi:MAG: hypothetical protein ABJH04_08130 [Cyclobacteriaceae bacterium]
MVYIIYEIDEHKSYSSIVIKHLDTNKRIAFDLFEGLKAKYKTKSGWYLILESFDPQDNAPRVDGNVFWNTKEVLCEFEDEF